MNFKGIFLQALRDKDPHLFRELVRTHQIDQFVQERDTEAHQLLAQLLGPVPKGVDGLPKDPQDLRLAEERVLQQMLDLPVPERDQLKEPPEDLPMPKSKAKTSPLSLAR